MGPKFVKKKTPHLKGLKYCVAQLNGGGKTVEGRGGTEDETQYYVRNGVNSSFLGLAPAGEMTLRCLGHEEKEEKRSDIEKKRLRHSTLNAIFPDHHGASLRT